MSVIDELRAIAPAQSNRKLSHPDQLFRASMLHECPRKQLLAAKGIDIAKSASTLRFLNIRDGAHSQVQRWLYYCLSVDHEVLLEEIVFDPSTHCGGHIDAIVVDGSIAYVCEIKTYAFLKGDPKENSYWQHQISFYYGTIHDQGRWPFVQPVMVIATLDGKLRIVEEPRVTDDYRQILFGLNMAWETDTLPLYGECRAFHDCPKCPLGTTCTEPIDTLSEFAEYVVTKAAEEPYDSTPF